MDVRRQGAPGFERPEQAGFSPVPDDDLQLQGGQQFENSRQARLPRFRFNLRNRILGKPTLCTNGRLRQTLIPAITTQHRAKLFRRFDRIVGHIV